MRLLFLLPVFAWTLLCNIRAVEFKTDEAAGKALTVCQVDLRKERLQLFLRDESGRPIKRFDRLSALLRPRNEKLVFALNAGMYYGDFSPVGLFIAEGKQLAPLNTAKAEGNFFLKPNGVFVVTDAGARV